MKRFVAFTLVFLMALLALPVCSSADGFDPESVSTPYICLMDSATGTILYEKNSRDKAYPASTTKIMTCILALELTDDVNEIISTGSDVETRGSTCRFSRNEKLPLIDALYGMMLFSGNDAAKAIALHFGGSEAGFAELMNKKAAELGMTGTHFVKPNGLHKDEHYSTAYDMAILTRYAMKNETFRKIVSAPTYDAAPTNKDSDGYQWYNSNRLLYTKEGETDYKYNYATGVKTGDTAQAGRCLVASAKKGDIELILVLLGDYEYKVKGEYRFENAAKFFDWGFDNFVSVNASELGLEPTLQLPVSNASLEDAEGGLLTVNIDFSGVKLTGLKETVNAIRSNPEQLTTNYVTSRKLEAPISAGEELGAITYQYNGATVFTAPLIASRDVAEAATILDNTASPNSSPLIVSAGEPEEDGGSGWLFWVLLIALLIVIVIFAKIVSARRRRRRAKKRRAYRSKYPTRRQ
ncbi:MAG: D-alanyl-D-alanine carboxypeptidase [Clostridiales bacterium]|nr:D-alanyl-D-alanine carboxypeptidase [Clostridiales bacterium]